MINIAKEIKAWLSLFGINIFVDDLIGNKLTKFNNGVTLMNLIEKIEKKSFVNWTTKPKNRAQCLMNIRRMLDIVK